jgi:hypothetical protein
MFNFFLSESHSPKNQKINKNKEIINLPYQQIYVLTTIFFNKKCLLLTYFLLTQNYKIEPYVGRSEFPIVIIKTYDYMQFFISTVNIKVDNLNYFS